jgi:hypothetical protein
MQESDGSRSRESSAAVKTSWLKEALLWLGVGTLILVAAAVFLPVLDGPHSREHANESSAAVETRRLNEAQQRYWSTHPSGFACQLSQLKPDDSHDDYENEFFTTGMRSGYVFTIASCARDAKGKATQYQITAVPQQPGKTGDKAFCSDQSGVTRLDASGSGPKCLHEGQPIVLD